ncbi:alpha/beta hydrolase [Faecalicatena sp. AGMB00832]|uniref:Alpha/beta hydrolase n=1 Tax=Faecalicatena faecalis TaxID=2726362 RepID=A0ABS6D1U5_9FIRM|nr:alpha/beta hydrolase [Faecalicatena faecalis]MBU3875567.1 alpha/beta hydrolase [Faecalicatena faecalis]
MQYEVISIKTEQSAPYARFHAYILDSSKQYQPDRIRPMIILCPGGGYEMTSDREAEPIAMRLLSMGYHVGILRYSVAPARFPTALLELAEVMKLVHENHEKWHVDWNQIFIQGSSAGGHLAASFGVFWNQPFLYEAAGTTPDILKPAGLILSYPVITSKKKYMHKSSFQCLLGSDYKEKKKELSIERLVTSDMPPCFIWHTFTDPTVPVENSLLLAEALKKAGVSTELHIYPTGGHGFSLADETTSNPDGSSICEPIQSWMKLLEVWLKQKTH